MTVAIHGKEISEKNTTYILELFDFLLKNQVEVSISERFQKIVSHFYSTSLFTTFSKRIPPNSNYVLSLGGDGTLLETITYVGSYETPVLAVNTGRLGFLATISPEDIKSATRKLITGEYEIDRRVLIHLDSHPQLFPGVNFALNDFTISKTDSSSMIKIHAFMDGYSLNSYWADGLIIATPTGSTGYSLSCGGPIVVPQSNHFIVTPVSPHNLSTRPLVVSGESTLTFQVESRTNNFLLSLDSRYETVRTDTQLTISKEQFEARLIRFKSQSFVDTLRQKLNWGLDVRN